MTGKAELLGGASDDRAQMIALGPVLAAYEGATGCNSWGTVGDSLCDLTTRPRPYLWGTPMHTHPFAYN
jgi:hypothetical protein